MDVVALQFCLSDHEFISEQTERQVRLYWYGAEPASELVEHEAGGDVGGVDGAAGRAAAGLVEEGGGVMSAAGFFGDGQNADDFAEHAAVGPEAAEIAGGAPDGF